MHNSRSLEREPCSEPGSGGGIIVGPVILLEMAWDRPNGESSLINSLIRDQFGGSDEAVCRFGGGVFCSVEASPFPHRANIAHARQSRPDSGLGLQVKILLLAASSLGSS